MRSRGYMTPPHWPSLACLFCHEEQPVWACDVTPSSDQRVLTLKYPPNAGIVHWSLIAPWNLHQLTNNMTKCSIVLPIVIVVSGEDERVVAGAEVV